MKVLIVFREPLELPTGRGYGLVISKASWAPSPIKQAYLDYIRVTALMYEATAGQEPESDEEFDGVLAWSRFAEKVQEDGVQYAEIEDFDDLEESDYNDELFTNKEKWVEIIGRKDLVWKR